MLFLGAPHQTAIDNTPMPQKREGKNETGGAQQVNERKNIKIK